MHEEVLVEQADSQRRRWRLPFSWLGIILLAWILFELTHSPALGSVCICLKFGWDDAQTALWLFRRDPQRGRAWTLLFLYLAWAAWKVAVVGFVMSMAFAAVTPRRVAAPAAPPQVLMAFAGTFLTAVLGFLLAALLTCLALLLGWTSRCRLWLDSGVRRARRYDFWPPTPFCLGRTNYLSYVVLSALILGVLTLIVVMILTTGRGRLTLLLTFLFSILAPILVLLLRETLINRIGAETPQECWPEEWDDESDPRPTSCLPASG